MREIYQINNRGGFHGCNGHTKARVSQRIK